MKKLFRRACEIAASEHGGCAPMPPELATGCVGIVVVISIALLLGAFFVWVLS
jgi:hypothetical protein